MPNISELISIDWEHQVPAGQLPEGAGLSRRHGPEGTPQHPGLRNLLQVRQERRGALRERCQGLLGWPGQRELEDWGHLVAGRHQPQEELPVLPDVLKDSADTDSFKMKMIFYWFLFSFIFFEMQLCENLLRTIHSRKFRFAFTNSLMWESNPGRLRG